jgi:spore germination protein KC
MKRAGRCAYVLAAFFMLIWLTGCDGMKDIDKRFFALEVGVDFSGNEEKPYRVTVKLGIPSPKIEPGQSNKYQLVTVDGETIAEAVRLMKSRVDKELDFGHAKVFIIGKSLMDTNLLQTMDWFFRRRDLQLIGYVAMGEPSAKDVLGTSVASERLPGNALMLSFDREGTESSYIVTETLSDFYRRLKERGKDPYMPIVWTDGRNYNINRVALFDKERLKLTLTPNQTRMFNELVRQFQRVEVAAGSDEQRLMLSINQLKVKYRLKPISGGLWSSVVNVSAAGLAEESMKPLYSESIERLEQQVEDEIKMRFSETLELMRDNGLDPVGFGLKYRAMNHKSEEEWEEWQERIYPNLQFDLKVNMKIYSTGVIK